MRMLQGQKTVVFGRILPIPLALLDKINAKDGDFVRVRVKLADGRVYLLPCRRLYGNTISLTRITHKIQIRDGDAVEILDVVKCTFLDYDVVPYIIADGLKKLIGNAQSMCVGFDAVRLIKNSEVIENENLVIHANHYSYAYMMLDAMVKAGLIAYAGRKRKYGRKYIICKYSELWDFIKNHDVGDIVDFVRKRIAVVENAR